MEEGRCKREDGRSEREEGKGAEVPRPLAFDSSGPGAGGGLCHLSFLV